MKLYPERCIFNVKSINFMSYLITHRGIKENPYQLKDIVDKLELTTKKQIMRLNGRLAALNRFISRAFDKIHPFTKLLKKKANFEWNDKCKKDLTNLKSYLLSPLVHFRQHDV